MIDQKTLIDKADVENVVGELAERLSADLEQVKRERDAARTDLDRAQSEALMSTIKQARSL